MDRFFDVKLQEKRLLNNVKRLSRSEREKVVGAYKLTKKYHFGQKRDEGGPYILHCLRVANCLIENAEIDNIDAICAALLHDAVEDTDLESSAIKKKFGKRTAQLVNNLTREKQPDEVELNKYQRKYQKFQEIRKKDLDTRAIKSCDWLDNINSWSKIPKNHPSYKKLTRWLKEAERMYLPLAKSVSPKLVEKMNRGLNEVRKSLDDKL